jgi:hypothetical protein
MRDSGLWPIYPKKMIATVRECTEEDAATLALIGAATLIEAFAGFVPGDALLVHCRKYHFPAAYESLFKQPQTRAWLAEVEPGAHPSPLPIFQPGFQTRATWNSGASTSSPNFTAAAPAVA